MATNTIDTMMNGIDTAVSEYVRGGYDALLANALPLVNTAVLLYIAWIGWKILMDKKISGGQLTKECLKIAIIYAIATDWSFFSTYIYNVLTNGPDALASLFITSADGSVDNSTSTLYKIFTQGVAIGKDFWEKGGMMSGFLYYVMAVDIWASVGILTGIAFVLIAVAKIFLGILIALCPVFVFFLFSNMLKSLTESWFKVTCGYALVPMMVNVALLFCINILNQCMKAIDAIHTNPEAANGDAIVAIILFDIAVYLAITLIVKGADLAHQVTGSMNLDTITAGIITKVQGFATPVTSLAKAAKNKFSKTMGGQ